ncbi:MAG: ABC transporter permease [Bacteroidales bacterium]|nr:ABC transporter permease [Bacteroidales bacterium]HNW73999.1 ABC transporter permease [Bacteroidales bacterium]HPS50623.1 ABC transporter permease [Bacteroidales bacterium]
MNTTTIENQQNTYPDEWTMIMRPKRSLLDVNLRELWQYRDLITLFVRRDFVSKYKQTILGPLWFIIQPLLTTIMFTIIFGNIAGISTGGIPKVLFYMSGIVGWTYFSTCLNDTSQTFIKNASIFGKVYFPRLALPISVVISNLVSFLIQFIFLCCFLVYFMIQGSDVAPNLLVLWIPVLVVIMAGLGLGFGIIISSMTTKYRDLTHLVTFGVTLWMYATPIIYPLSEIPEKFKILVIANPMTPVIETFKTALLGVGEINYLQLLYSVGFMIVLLAVGIVIFNKVEKTFMDTV